MQGLEMSGLGDFEGQDDAALLSLRSKGGGFEAIQGNFQIVAVGASHRLAQTLLLPARGGEAFSK
ncbi:MAG: hypothetical protein ACK55I_45280, partial [bacterium]